MNEQPYKFLIGYINNNNQNIKEIGYLSDDKVEMLFDEFFVYYKYNICKKDLNSCLFAMAMLNKNFLYNIIDSNLYIDFLDHVIYLRKYSNDINHVLVWDCVFKFCLNKFNNTFDKEFDCKIFYMNALSQKDKFFNAFRTAVDKFCFEHKVKIPMRIMKGFYNEDSKHFKKIINQLDYS